MLTSSKRWLSIKIVYLLRRGKNVGKSHIFFFVYLLSVYFKSYQFIKIKLDIQLQISRHNYYKIFLFLLPSPKISMYLLLRSVLEALEKKLLFVSFTYTIVLLFGK
jgi:hypothetical protein